MASTFTAIPTLHLCEARAAETKPRFLAQLRAALLNVGFLYLAHTGLPPRLVEEVCGQCRAFFEDLSPADKLAVEMKNERSFLGYSRLGNEVTAGKADWREQLDLSTPHRLAGPASPPWHHLWGPNQWPSADKLPRFRDTFEEYMRLMGEMSLFFTSLIAEAIGLPADAFDRFFERDQQHKLKLVKYPDAASGAGAGQGVGPHKDSMLTSFLLQASGHAGLQAQNLAGEWVDCPPRPGTLVVAIGQGLEAITEGVCASTTHRVLSPAAGAGPRYSVPFFSGVSFDAAFESMAVPDGVKSLRPLARRDGVEFTFTAARYANLGEATLMNRVKSHPDVGEKFYPELLARIRRDEAAAAAARAQREREADANDDADADTEVEMAVGGAAAAGPTVQAH